MATPTVTNPADTVSALLAGTYGDAARAIAQQEVSAAWSRGNIAAASILAEISRRLIAHIVDEFAARGVTVPQDVIEHAEDVLTTLPESHMSPPQSLIENVPSPMALGIVGSTAYGLDTPDSDVDRLGVYVESTEKFLGLNPPSRERATIVRHNDDGDVQWHEAGKFVGLVLSGNPTVSELLWLPERCYEIRNAYFEMLRPLRHRLLCADGVRNAYFGYASQQFKRLVERGRFGGSDETRREKHARHLLRLVDQGLYAYEHGEIVVEVDDPERYHAFGQACRDSTEPARRALAEAEQRFDTITTPLPQYPDRDVADTWLRMVRFAYLEVPA